jgi:hypothetical protein
VTAATEQLFVNIIIILVAARILGEVFQHIGQAPLVGELLAGLMMAPSIVALVLPCRPSHAFKPSCVLFDVPGRPRYGSPRDQTLRQVSNSDTDHCILHPTAIWHMLIACFRASNSSVTIHGITLVNNCCTCECDSAN